MSIARNSAAICGGAARLAEDAIPIAPRGRRTAMVAASKSDCIGGRTSLVSHLVGFFTPLCTSEASLHLCELVSLRAKAQWSSAATSPACTPASSRASWRPRPPWHPPRRPPPRSSRRRPPRAARVDKHRVEYFLLLRGRFFFAKYLLRIRYDAATAVLGEAVGDAAGALALVATHLGSVGLPSAK